MKDKQVVSLRLPLVLVFATLVVGGPGHAGSDIDGDLKYAWSENVGWTNWRPSDTDCVVVGERHLEGYAWAENVGWINVGNGLAMGEEYENTDHTDFGVNVDVDGSLTGMAWGENVGWVVFGDGTTGSFASISDGRFTGHAWGENIGWINFDDPDVFVALAEDPENQFLRGDVDGNGTLFPIIDALFLLEYGFTDGPTPPCLDAADVDGNDSVFAIIDALYLLEYGFTDGPPPPDPGPAVCGEDPADDTVSCEKPGDGCV